MKIRKIFLSLIAAAVLVPNTGAAASSFSRRINEQDTIGTAALTRNGIMGREAIEREFGVKDAMVKYDTRAEMMADISKTGGEYCDYPFDNPKMTPAPAGYKPFYISHIGRHGARYAISDDIYEKIHKVLTEAHETGKLNAAGEDLRDRFERLYPIAAHRGGDLTKKGQAQLHEIAAVMYRNFPEVFKGKTHAEVLSTPIPRVMLSMVAFLDELKDRDKDFSFEVDASRAFYPIMEPNKTISPIKVKVPLSPESVESAKEFEKGKIDAKGFCSRYFNDLEYLESAYGLWKFESDLRNVVCAMTGLDDVDKNLFAGIFTDEELFNIWDVRNYNGYIYMGRTPLSDDMNSNNNSNILKYMILQADKDIASGKVQLSLRFSHDTAILPMISFMKLDNFGAVVNDPEEVKNYWRSDLLTMASNVQLIFFRSKKNPEILVKVLYNGHEASLPLPEVKKSFYAWSAFRAHYLTRIEKSLPEALK